MSTTRAWWIVSTLLFAVVAALTMGANVDGADEPGRKLTPAFGEVTLALEGVSAERGEGDDTLFDCRVALVNDTGTELTARSNFYSFFDGLELVVYDTSGKKLARQSYLWHQSPYTFDRRSFPVAKGVNRGRLVFPMGDLGPGVRRVKVQIVGVLPGCDRSDILLTDVVDVEIVRRPANGTEVKSPDPATKGGPAKPSPGRAANPRSRADSIKGSASHRRS